MLTQIYFQQILLDFTQISLENYVDRYFISIEIYLDKCKMKYMLYKF